MWGQRYLWCLCYGYTHTYGCLPTCTSFIWRPPPRYLLLAVQVYTGHSLPPLRMHVTLIPLLTFSSTLPAMLLFLWKAITVVVIILLSSRSTLSCSRGLWLRSKRPLPTLDSMCNAFQVHDQQCRCSPEKPPQLLWLYVTGFEKRAHFRQFWMHRLQKPHISAIQYAI